MISRAAPLRAGPTGEVLPAFFPLELLFTGYHDGTRAKRLFFGGARHNRASRSEFQMPDHDPGLHFVVQMALRNALRLVRGLRRQISEAEESVMGGQAAG